MTDLERERQLMTDVVVAELDRYLDRDETVGFTEMVQRARDEIVALREMRDAHIRILSARLDEDEENMRRWIAKARAEALEEAALVCEEPARRLREELGWSAEAELLERYAAAIRTLKERPRQP